MLIEIAFERMREAAIFDSVLTRQALGAAPTPGAQRSFGKLRSDFFEEIGASGLNGGDALHRQEGVAVRPQRQLIR